MSVTQYKQPIVNVTGASLLKELQLLEFGVYHYQTQLEDTKWWQFKMRKQATANYLLFKFRLYCFEDMLTRLETEE